MKDDWAKLSDSFEDSKDQLIADVDCTAEGEPLCAQFAVEGFPSLKWGDPADLQDYAGGRDYESLKEFADANLTPSCSPANLELCDEEEKAEIAKYMRMTPEHLAVAIEMSEDGLAQLDADFEEFIEGLQKSYEDMMEKNQKEKDAIQKEGLGLMKAVRAFLAPKEAANISDGSGASDEL